MQECICHAHHLTPAALSSLTTSSATCSTRKAYTLSIRSSCCSTYAISNARACREDQAASESDKSAGRGTYELDVVRYDLLDLHVTLKTLPQNSFCCGCTHWEENFHAFNDYCRFGDHLAEVGLHLLTSTKGICIYLEATTKGSFCSR